MDKYNVILHIPHASLELPSEFFVGCVCEQLEKYLEITADIRIDELFKSDKFTIIKPAYSRLYCDVERFIDDDIEKMAKYGQGVVYTHNYDGTLLHVHNENYRNKVLEYYHLYHKSFDECIMKMIIKRQPILILDCHSFGENMVKYFHVPPYPDICIGIEKEYCDDNLVEQIMKLFERENYAVLINAPYAGSIVPNCILNGSGNTGVKIVTIMIEINKRTYDDKVKYEKLKGVIGELLDSLE